MCALASPVVHQPASLPASSTSRSRHWGCSGQKTWMPFLRIAGMTSCSPEAKPAPCASCRPSDRSDRFCSSAPWSCVHQGDRQTQELCQKAPFYNAPFKMDRSLVTLTIPAVVQPGYQCLASHVQWRRNRDGHFTHSGPLTTDLGRGHGVGGSADGVLGYEFSAHSETEQGFLRYSSASERHTDESS